MPLFQTTALPLAVGVAMLGVALADAAHAAEPAAPIVRADRATFSELIERYARAWSLRDGKLDRQALSRLYAHDANLVFFDLTLGQRLEGFAEVQRQGEQVAKMFRYLQFIPEPDLVVREAGPGFAWTTATYALDGQLNDGTILSVPVRQTAVWRQQGKDWKIVHDHVSAPLAMPGREPQP